MKMKRKIVVFAAAFAVAVSAGSLLVTSHADAAETSISEPYLNESLNKTDRLFGIEIPALGLTEEQKTDILERVVELQNQGINLEEVRTEIQNMLQKFGVSGEQNSDINEIVERINEKFNWANNHNFYLISNRGVKT